MILPLYVHLWELKTQFNTWLLEVQLGLDCQRWDAAKRVFILKYNQDVVQSKLQCPLLKPPLWILTLSFLLSFSEMGQLAKRANLNSHHQHVGKFYLLKSSLTVNASQQIDGCVFLGAFRLILHIIIHQWISLHRKSWEHPLSTLFPPCFFWRLINASWDTPPVSVILYWILVSPCRAHIFWFVQTPFI